MKKRIISQEYLLEVAHLIALNEGPEALSIRNVAKSANVSIGSVYNYFESKEAMTLKLIDNLWDTYYEKTTDELLNHTSYIDFLKLSYQSLYNLTLNVYSIFDFHIRNSNDVSKKEAFESHKRQVTMIFDLFYKVLNKDESIDKSIWNEAFNDVAFNWFVVKNYFFSIKQKEPNVDFLVAIVEKILYKK